MGSGVVGWVLWVYGHDSGAVGVPPSGVYGLMGSGVARWVFHPQVCMD